MSSLKFFGCWDRGGYQEPMIGYGLTKGLSYESGLLKKPSKRLEKIIACGLDFKSIKIKF
jgi:hypothetical protein